MSDCCDPTPYRHLFNSKDAAHRLARYRKKGLDERAADIVRYLADSGISGADVLEVGGGVGGVQVELLTQGASRATNIELSEGYELAAAELSAEAGFADRMERRFGDFVELQSEVDAADIVVLNRVLCCYPFMEEMMDAAVEKSNRFLALVFPKEMFFTKVAVKVGNVYCAVRGVDFKGFVHPVARIEQIATDAGFGPVLRSDGIYWQAVVFERTA